MQDPVNHPKHYTQGGIECIDALASATANLVGVEAICTANAIKYLWRWKEKGGVEDLRKAMWYINKLIELQTKPDLSKFFENTGPHTYMMADKECGK
jgi:hypothetical protein